MVDDDAQTSTIDVDDETAFDETAFDETAFDETAFASFLDGDSAADRRRESAWTELVAMASCSLRDAVRGIRRRPGLAASAALTVSLCAVLAGRRSDRTGGVDATMSRWADGVEFVVYLQPGVDRADVARVHDELQHADGVRRVTRVTQQQAYEEYRRLYSADSTMTEAVTPDLLPSSFRVTPDDADPGLIQQITRPLASDPSVYQVVTADEAVRDVRDLSGAVSGFGSWLAVILGVVGIVLSATMIRSSIASRQREIDMMRSLGASRAYIAAPVVIEGVLIGVAGATIAALLLTGAAIRASASTSSVVSSLLPPTSEARTTILAVVVVTVLVCAAVSVLTTIDSLRRSR